MIYLRLFYQFLKIGAFTFGGGYAMLPLVSETVIKLGWLSENQVVDFVAVSESTPGPFAVNISTYVGARTAGVLGAIFATLGVVIPSFVIILIVSKCYDKFRSNKLVNAVFEGLKPAVISLIASAVLSVFMNTFDVGGVDRIISKANAAALGIVTVAAVMTYKKVHPIKIIIICAVMGVAVGLVHII